MKASHRCFGSREGAVLEDGEVITPCNQPPVKVEKKNEKKKVAKNPKSNRKTYLTFVCPKSTIYIQIWRCGSFLGGERQIASLPVSECSFCIVLNLLIYFYIMVLVSWDKNRSLKCSCWYFQGLHTPIQTRCYCGSYSGHEDQCQEEYVFLQFVSCILYEIFLLALGCGHFWGRIKELWADSLQFPRNVTLFSTTKNWRKQQVVISLGAGN